MRFTGCDLRCNYCDTAYAFNGGPGGEPRRRSWPRWPATPASLVLLTGGEPHAAARAPRRWPRDLLDRGYEVLVETHGQRPLDALPGAVVRIADVKTPESGEPATDLAWLSTGFARTTR